MDEYMRWTPTKGYPWKTAYREALSPYIFRRVLVLLGLHLAAYPYVFPLANGDLAWTQRTAYFSLSLTLCAPLCYAEYAVTLYLTRFWTRWRIALAVVGTTFVAAPTATVIAFGVATLLFPGVLAFSDLPAVYLFKTMSVLFCAAVVHYLVSQRVGNEAGSALLTDEPSETPAADAPDRRAPVPAAAGAASPAAFLRRLPVEAGRDVIYLKMSDHYVEVVTATGHCTLLMRFTDAIEELGNEGIRVHRSYWVSLRHVRGWTRRKQRMFLQLTGGHMVPVSRTYAAPARAAVDRLKPPAVTSEPESS